MIYKRLSAQYKGMANRSWKLIAMFLPHIIGELKGLSYSVNLLQWLSITGVVVNTISSYQDRAILDQIEHDLKEIKSKRRLLDAELEVCQGHSTGSKRT
ncbi:hypothetical protein VTN96DRAFT_9966 [Rasamsonia emersonii]|uniref:Uncharacterized protein n=1 Tax=Rasamsonia emersonii (strain ATCC 16479 / CBS 393.64 / IMI 116815) TaxID=1408163 RepID=A0A0F4Z3D1_RASE3|nr:hypothetical protein T310_1568 [Rasamsonia emersonii CBS 393.64]KKA24383.1 hypothetical protein T310_1568 [Rasamsonia emersonii CBS 393.64]